MLKSLPSLLADLLRRFKRDNRGNVAVIFALATLPIIGFVGAAVDFSHANSVKASLQAALDSTALMLAKYAPTHTSAEIQDQASKYFKALFNDPTATEHRAHRDLYDRRRHQSGGRRFGAGPHRFHGGAGRATT